MVSNMAVALAEKGRHVMVVGCDPKADPTCNLISCRILTILEDFREKVPSR